MYRKNAVLNYTEMESKVREATNNDAWGASSTLLLEIARGTNHYQQFNEIMPTIYKRFAEVKQNWRQVYKTLQLVEYLLKNGSERVIDNVRDHIYEIKSLLNYQFVDEKGKDQGINVRHRAKEIVELIEDANRLRSEREKATQNRNKYTGVASEEARRGGFGASSAAGASSSSDRYGGFGSDSYPGAASSAANASFGLSNSGHNMAKKASNSDIPAVIMAAEKEQKQGATTVVQQPSVAAQPNLLDLDFDAPAAAPVQAVPIVDSWGTFTATSSQNAGNPADAFGDFSTFQAAPTVTATVQSVSAAPISSGFTSFQSQPVAPGVSNIGFSNFTAAPAIASSWVPMAASAAPAVSNVVAGNIGQTPKKPNDVWQSNLVALDSLSKYNYPAQKESGPPLNQISATNAGFSAFSGPPPAMSAGINHSSNQWGSTAAPTGQQPTQSQKNNDSLLL